MSPEKAEQWVTGWEAEAALPRLDRRSAEFWAVASDWIAAKRR